MHELRKKFVLIGILLVLAAGASVLSTVPLRSSAPPSQSLADSIRTGRAPIPSFATSTREKLAASHGFQYLISYTDQGFEPAQLALKLGETVRFTNNSSHDIWIAASGSPLYPAVVNGCGSSELDSCSPFPPQDFWEFTFGVPGNWEVVNNLDKSQSGMVHVK